MNEDIHSVGDGYHTAVYAAGLIGYGYHVDEARTVDGARVRLRAGILPHVIIIDLRHADTHVFRLIQYLRQELNRWDIGVIVIGHQTQAEGCYLAGANRFLTRPVEIDGLLDNVRALTAPELQ